MSETYKLTYAEVLQGLREVVRSKPPGYVYKADGESGQCNYWDRDEECPACLIGTYLYTLGYENGLLQDMDEDTDPAWGENSTAPHAAFTDKANDLMQFAQQYQDRESPWSDAVDGAERHVKMRSQPHNQHYNDNEERI